MKITCTRIAIFFAFTFLFVTSLNAQSYYGFAIGLKHTDTTEIISYLARESPLHDEDIAVGDEIVAINGLTVRGIDVTRSNILAEDTIIFRVHCRRDDRYVDAQVTRAHLRIRNSGPIALLDNTTAIIQGAAFSAEKIEAIETILDSLAKGSNGFGNCTDTALIREDEARNYTLRQYGGRIPRNQAAQFHNDMISYIMDKYGWQMQRLLVDVKGTPIPEVLRAIRRFCKEHQIELLREL
jgi:hypothetical protein